jgi:hypothetical protein
VTRQEIKAWTIGACDFDKGQRLKQRKHKALMRERRRRRGRGAKPREQYEAEALTNTRPWEALRISRRTWERRQRAERVASPCALTLIPINRVASPCAVPLAYLSAQGVASAGRPHAAVRGGACRQITDFSMGWARATIWRDLQNGACAVAFDHRMASVGWAANADAARASERARR